MTETCPLCGDLHSQPMFEEQGHTVVSCDTCDLLYITPYPRQVGDVYEAVSDYDYDQLQILSAERHYQSSCRRYGWLYPRIRPHCAAARSVLDVGCGTGRLLELLGEFPDLERVGMELNVERAKFAREKAACEVVSVPLEQYPRKDFDVITLMDLFSHVPDVNGFFRSVHEHLAPQGLAILKVGEFAKTAGKHTVFDWEIPDHLQFLGLRTIDHLATQTGFEVALHEREPLSKEMFAKEAWRSPGRSALRNRIKRAVTLTPGALPLLRAIYDLYTRRAAFSSFVVLRKA